MFSFRNFFSVLIVIVGSAIVVFSQANGKVNGTVTDPNGAGVPGAVVKLQSQATKIEIETTTNDSGYFKHLPHNRTSVRDRGDQHGSLTYSTVIFRLRNGHPRKGGSGSAIEW